MKYSKAFKFLISLGVITLPMGIGILIIMFAMISEID